MRSLWIASKSALPLLFLSFLSYAHFKAPKTLIESAFFPFSLFTNGVVIIPNGLCGRFPIDFSV